MDRIDAILNHPVFIDHLQRNNEAEANRRFCRHNIGHLLDVARIGWILNLERSLGMEQEVIYAAALLHDIGKHLQYTQGIPHEVASAEIAPGILKDCGFLVKESKEIISAILAHRDFSVANDNGLKGVLYQADKASRACFFCEAEKDCNWKGEKKNLQIKY